MDRRTFIEKSIVGGAAITFSNSFLGCSTKSDFPKRKLGRADDMLSIVGFGGIIVSEEPQAVANGVVANAVEAGINYFDVAPTYGDAEEKLGPALEPYRKKCFLACKTNKRDKVGAVEELYSSMLKLKTDYFDLYQLHGLSTPNEVEHAFGPNGAFEVLLKAKKEGKVRYLGFSAHSEEAALLAMDKYDFDTILFPINYVSWHSGDFGPKVIAKAKETNKGILAIKGMAHTRRQAGEERRYKKTWYQPIDINDEVLLGMAFRWTLSQGITAAIPPGEPSYFSRALDIARNFQTSTPEETQKLVEVAQEVQPIFPV